MRRIRLIYTDLKICANLPNPRHLRAMLKLQLQHFFPLNIQHR